MRLEGAVALVTGGAGGLGLAIALSLQAAGATVVVVDRDGERLAALPDGLEGRLLDVTDAEAAQEAAAAIVAAHGRIDILVNNAGLIHSELMIDLTRPDQLMHDLGRFRRCLSANLESVFIMGSAVVEQMARRRTRGVIVNISSISARGNEGQSAYSAAKAGVEAMTVTWAKELGRLGIRCNAVAPGFIDTPSTKSSLSEANLRHVRDNTPLRRLGEARNVAQAVLGLIENDFVTGAILDVNGGLSI